jgi:hypothetical protein
MDSTPLINMFVSTLKLSSTPLDCQDGTRLVNFVTQKPIKLINNMYNLFFQLMVDEMKHSN